MRINALGDTGFMRAMATAIVNGRFVVFALFLVACIYCGLSVGRVQLESTLTAFLPESTETRQGIDVMADEFTSYASASVMVSNVTYEIASDLAEDIREVDHVVGVSLDDSPTHFAHSSALLSISFDGKSNDPAIKASMGQIRQMVEPYDNYISTGVGSNYMAQLAEEMVGVVAIAAIVIALILLLTSRSYFEVAVSLLVFVVAALLNMGTNFWLGKISSISNSVAIVLQLALAIDYAIILSHRYQDTASQFENPKEAVIDALSHAIPEIASSSLTTISGLLALTLMQFGLGPDLGLVLAKGILCSLISVFFLMPGLILCAARLLKKTAHKPLLPSIEGWGRLLGRAKNCFVGAFCLILPFAIYFSSQTTWAFSDNTVSSLIYSESRFAQEKITNTFDEATSVAIIVPSGNYQAEKELLQQVEKLPEIKSVMGLANITVSDTDDAVLTDMFTPRKLAELLDIDVEQATLVFQAYGLEHQQYQGIFGNANSYTVPLIDLFEFMFEKMDQGVITLEGGRADTLTDLRDTLSRATDQLRGPVHSRMVATATVPAESPESVALVETIRGLAEDHYGKGNVLITGNITSARDLSESFSGDSKLISILTALFVFIILLFTFRSVAAAVMMVLVIQGAIWINFSFPYLTHFTSSFVTYMICSAIQMGATIDYAIVMMNRYQDARRTLEPKPAMAKAVAGAFPTVLTSGLIMGVAGLLIAFRVSDVYVGHIGLGVGRGAIISVILVLTVLPQLLVLLDGWIEKTRFELPKLRNLRAPKAAAAPVAALLALALLTGAPVAPLHDKFPGTLSGFWAPAVAFADEGEEVVRISTAEQLEALAARCSVDAASEGLTVELVADIELGSSSFRGIPYFAGAFHGNGHTVSGFAAENGSHQGFFRYVSYEGSVSNLQVRGTVSPSGSATCVGGIAGSNAGVLAGCSFEGTVAGVTQVGGIAGENTGTITGCTAKGQVTGEHQVGGIAGSNDGTLEDCANSAQVNTTAVADTSSKTGTQGALSLLGVLSSGLGGVTEEDVLNITDTGGVAGLNTGLISGCANNQTVGYAHMGYNVGGIAGRSNGIVAGCVNSAQVLGRKDVGGIVGQLEPYTKWDLSASKLADLQGKVSGLSGAVNSAISHLGGATKGAAPYLQSMRGYLETAASELARIARSASGADDLKDADYTAFLSALSSAFGAAGQLANYAGEQGSTLASDVSSINSAFSAVTGSLGSTASSIANVSIDTENDISATDSAASTGCVRGCQNRGAVAADTAAGGVVGSIAYEVSFDPEGSLNLTDALFTKAQYLVSATVLDCESTGDVTAKKQAAGGMVGAMNFGAVLDCVASGAVEVTAGNYAGGVVGQARGTIAASHARATVKASAYAGGIAGTVNEGGTLADCLAYAQVTDVRECAGSIAGAAAGTVEGCFFVEGEDAPGGIDGISYEGQALPLSYGEMVARDDAPNMFKQVTVAFVGESGVVKTVTVAYGAAIEELPLVPAREGKYWRWDVDLSELQSVRFSRIVEGSYRNAVTTLGTQGDHPLFLVEGQFSDGQRLTAADVLATPEMVGAGAGEELVACATLSVNDYSGPLTVRVRANGSGRAYVRQADGTFSQVNATVDGSYAVFEAENGSTVAFVRGADSSPAPLILVGVAVLVLVLCGVVLWKRARNK